MAKNYLRPREIEECKADLRAVQAAPAAAQQFGKTISHQSLRESKQAIEKRLEQAPPDLTSDQRDKVSKRVKELESKIQEGMLSHEEMRRGPPGAVEQNVAWTKANRDNIRNWKNGILALMKGASQPDVQKAIDIRRLRPHSNHMNMDNAQIPVKTAYSFPSDAYKNGYDNIDWHRDSKPTDEDFDAEE